MYRNNFHLINDKTTIYRHKSRIKRYSIYFLRDQIAFYETICFSVFGFSVLEISLFYFSLHTRIHNKQKVPMASDKRVLGV